MRKLRCEYRRDNDIFPWWLDNQTVRAYAIQGCKGYSCEEYAKLYRKSCIFCKKLKLIESKK